MPELWIIDLDLSRRWLENASQSIKNARGAMKAVGNVGGSKELQSLISKRLFKYPIQRLEIERLQKTLEPFEGSSLVLTVSNLDVEKIDAARWFKPIDSEEDDYILSGRVGRPRKKDAAIQAYRSLYPQGHRGTSWKEVAREVSELIGDSVSIDTIKRAISENEKMRETEK